MKERAIEISKEILKYLFLAGVIYVAASSPSFSFRLARTVFKNKPSKFSKRKAIDAFSYLKRRGLLEITRDGADICVALTKAGKERAGKYQVDDLTIKKPQKWDGKWRVVIFDIPNESKIKRDAFRRKLKELGFYSLQKSVWAHPFECKEEIGLLKNFFGLGAAKIQLILADKIEKDAPLKNVYKL